MWRFTARMPVGKWRILAWGASRWPKMCSCHPGGDPNSWITGADRRIIYPSRCHHVPSCLVVATQRCFIFTPKLGEDSHFDSYFSMGWNHQLVLFDDFPRWVVLWTSRCGGRCYFLGRFFLPSMRVICSPQGESLPVKWDTVGIDRII